MWLYLENDESSELRMSEEFDQFDEIHPFVTSMIKPRIPSTNEAPYLHNDHHKKVKNFKKPRLQQKAEQ
jgi:hypothetical protein